MNVKGEVIIPKVRYVENFIHIQKTTYRWESVDGLLYNLSFGRRKIYEEKFLYWVCLYNSADL